MILKGFTKEQIDLAAKQARKVCGAKIGQKFGYFERRQEIDNTNTTGPISYGGLYHEGCDDFKSFEQFILHLFLQNDNGTVVTYEPQPTFTSLGDFLANVDKLRQQIPSST